MSDQPLWSPTPERVRATRVVAFLGEANRRHQLSLAGYRDLHAWSVKHPDLFWDLLWDFGGVIGRKAHGSPSISMPCLGRNSFPTPS